MESVKENEKRKGEEYKEIVEGISRCCAVRRPQKADEAEKVYVLEHSDRHRSKKKMSHV